MDDKWWNELRNQIPMTIGCSNRVTVSLWFREFLDIHGKRLIVRTSENYTHLRFGPKNCLIVKVPGLKGNDVMGQYLEYAWGHWRASPPEPLYNEAIPQRYYKPLMMVRWEWQGLGLLGSGIWTSGPAIFLRGQVGPPHPDVVAGAKARGHKCLNTYIDRYFLNGDPNVKEPVLGSDLADNRAVSDEHDGEQGEE